MSLQPLMFLTGKHILLFLAHPYSPSLPFYGFFPVPKLKLHLKGYCLGTVDQSIFYRIKYGELVLSNDN